MDTPKVPSRQASLSKDRANGSKSSSKERQHAVDPPPLVQNVLLVWLDEKIHEPNNEFWRLAISTFREEIYDVHTFDASDPCLLFLSQRNDDNICLIISGSLSQKIIPAVYSMSQVHTILIFCENKKGIRRWAKNWTKISGVFTHSAPIRDALRDVAHECEQNAMGMNFMPVMEDEPPHSFLYPLMLRNILPGVQSDEQAVKQFTEYCREVFYKNDYQLNQAKEFARTYREKTPIAWYTQRGFVSPMVNRALRLMDVPTIIKMGFFVADLHQQIEQLHAEQYRNGPGQPLVFHRGQGMKKPDFEQLTKNKDNWVSFNNFLLANTDSTVSLDVARRAMNNPDLFGVVFVITVNSSKASAPFAAISKVSSVENTKDDILFSLGSVFRVHDVKKLENNARLWQVELLLVASDEPQLRALSEPMRESSPLNSSGWGRLALSLIKTGQLDKAEHVYKTMLRETSDDQQRAGIYHQLGWIEDSRGQYPLAVACYKKSLEIAQRMHSADHPDLALSYNNLGLSYYNMGEYVKALAAHEKALAIRRKTLSEQHPDLAMSLNNIGMVHVNMENFSKAAPFCEQAVNIGGRSLPADHAHLQQYRKNFDLVKTKL